MSDQSTDPAGDDPAKAEKEAYWTEFSGRLDTWFDNKVKTLRETHTSRTGGRVTGLGIISDLFFGSPKNDK